MENKITVYQSMWFAPFLSEKVNDKYHTGRVIGGWRNKIHFYMSWALSFYRLRQHYSNLVLVTDSPGKDILYDKLGLKYNNVVCHFDSIEYDPLLWAIGKIHTYTLAEVPFLHFDGDVFIWEQIKPFGNDCELIFQNYEHNHPYYKASLNEIEKQFSYIPAEIEELLHIKGNILSINAGVIGSNCKSFIDEFTSVALDFVHKNENCLHKITAGVFNTVYEQLLCFLLAKKRNIKLTPVLNIPKSGKFDIISFDKVPNKNKYIHPIGSFKSQNRIAFEIERRLALEFPEVYKRILQLNLDGSLI